MSTKRMLTYMCLICPSVLTFLSLFIFYISFRTYESVSNIRLNRSLYRSLLYTLV